MVERLFEKIGSISEKHPWWVILAAAIVTVLAVAGLARTTSEFGYKTMLPKQAESVVALKEADKVFSGTSEEQVLIEAPDVLRADILRKIADYPTELAQQESLWPEFANDVTTPLDDMVYIPVGELPADTAETPGDSSVQSMLNGAEPLAEKAPSLSDEELARQVELNLEISGEKAEKAGFPSRSQSISEDNRAALIKVRLNPALKSAEQMKMVRNFEDWTKSHFEDLSDAQVYVTGLASMNKDSNERTIEDTRLLFGLALLFIIFVLFITFRRLSDILLTLLVILLTVVWVLGMGGWLGFPITYTTSGVIPLLLGIDIAYAIHVLSRYYEERESGADTHQSAVKSVRTVGIAVFLTAGTTAFGFASFGISNMPPIQQFGALCVAGVMFSFVLAVTLLPACLVLRDRSDKARARYEKRLAKKRSKANGGLVDKVLVKVAIVSEHHRVLVLIATLLIVVGSIVIGTQVTTEADMMKMMPQDMPYMVAQNEVSGYFGGQDLTYTLVKGDILAPENLEAMLEYEDDLADSGIRTEEGEESFSREKLFSIADLVQGMNGSIPESESEVMAVLMSLRTGAKSESSNNFINPEYPDTTMIAMRLSRGDQGDMKRVAEAVRAENEKMEKKSDLEFSSSGMPLLMTDMLGSIVPTQMKTSAVALVLCALLVTIVFGSLFFGLAATSVVFIGIALEIGVLVLLGWPLDFMTVMVSSLVIGAGIDFGIHVTHRFREEWHHGGVEIDEAIRRTIHNVGKALIAAAVTTAGAFGIIAISDLAYMRRFGGITALSLTFALLAALLVLPSLLAWWAARVERNRARKEGAA